MKEAKEVLAEGKFIRLVRRGRWEWAERTNTAGGAVIVALTRQRQIVLVEQYRPPLDVRVIELPAGLTDESSILFLARRAKKTAPGGGDALEDITVLQSTGPSRPHHRRCACTR